jgi:hypothetical protein
MMMIRVPAAAVARRQGVQTFFLGVREAAGAVCRCATARAQRAAFGHTKSNYEQRILHENDVLQMFTYNNFEERVPVKK